MPVKAIFGTPFVSFNDKNDSLLQCDIYDVSFNLSQYLKVSNSALIAKGNRLVSPLAAVFVVCLLAPINTVAKFGLDFFRYKIFTCSNLYVDFYS